MAKILTCFQRGRCSSQCEIRTNDIESTPDALMLSTAIFTSILRDIDDRFLTLLAVFLVLFVAYKATMYFWTIRLFRAYAYLHRIEHSKSWGREVDEEVVKAANNFAKEYPLSRLPIDFSGAYVETVLDDFNGSRRAFYAFAKAQGYQK